MLRGPGRTRRLGRSVWPTWRVVASGYSVLELVFVAGTIGTLSGIAVPQFLTALDNFRTAGAARYVSARLQRVRMEAVMRSADVALQVTQTAGGYCFGVYADGNRNGIRTRDIQRGIDRALGATERLADHFTGVDFGAIRNLPPVDPGGTPPGDDPIRIGAGNLATFTTAGTATAGSVYIRGRTAQYVVRIFGETGKTRVLKFDSRTRQWRPL